MAVLRRVACYVLAVLLTAGCRMGQEQWGPFRAQVVDFDTGGPIAGAYVMVMWIRDRPSLHSGESFYDARETRTGADGWFEIPYERRWMTAFVTEPRISVFVPGHVMEGAAVVTGEGRAYRDPTFIGMRLQSEAEQCKYPPVLPVLTPREAVPVFAAAMHDYTVNLSCRTID